MSREPSERRRANLEKLRMGAQTWHKIYALLVIMVLPLLTRGTEVHEYAVILRNFGIIGILLGTAYSQWTKRVLRWHERTGRDFEGPWFVPMLLGGTLPGTLFTYVALRMHGHEGNWDATLAFSRDDAVLALGINIVLCLGGGYIATMVTHYRKGENPVLKHGEPMSFGKLVALLLAIPVLVILATFMTWLMR